MHCPLACRWLHIILAAHSGLMPRAQFWLPSTAAEFMLLWHVAHSDRLLASASVSNQHARLGRLNRPLGRLHGPLGRLHVQ